jgi:hypothetical protein
MRTPSPSAGSDPSEPSAWTTFSYSMSAICRRSWPNMSAISTTGVRIDRWDNGRPAHRRQMLVIQAPKLERSSRYLCSEAFITFISKPYDDDAALILAPYSYHLRDLDGDRRGVRHRFCLLPRELSRNRTPGPLVSSSSINSTPAISRARRHLFTVPCLESVLFNSKSRMVGMPTPDFSASFSRDHPTIARAARSCAGVIID